MSKAERYIELVSDENGHLYDQHALRAVEIAREEIIDKACKYLDLHCDEVKTEDNGIAGWIDNEFINNFKQAMKDE